jgi:hypothetical protein
VGDKVWLHLLKEHLIGSHQKLNLLQFRPYTISKVVIENAFELSIPPFLGLHPIFNVELLQPHSPPLLDILEVVEHLAPTEVNLDYIEQGTLIESWTSR